MRVHQLRIDFNVTPEIKRYVYVYLLEGENCYLIDSGVYGCQDQIHAKLRELGRELSDVKGIFLTHAHPDHIGSAKWFREHTGCKVYASAGEAPWICDIDKQFAKRPIPNFYQLAGQSCEVDVLLKGGDQVELGADGVLEVISTPGHSVEELSYRWGKDLFIGDAVPVKGDIPIFIDRDQSVQSLQRILEQTGVATFYPAWDTTYSMPELEVKIADAMELIQTITDAARQAADITTEPKELAARVCDLLQMPMLMNNPLFIQTVSCCVKAD